MPKDPVLRGRINVPNFVVLQQLVACDSLVLILGGIDLSNKVLLGHNRARDRQVVGRDEVHIQRVVEKAVVKTLQHMVLRVAVSAEQLGVELEVVLRKPLCEVFDARIGKMAKV